MNEIENWLEHKFSKNFLQLAIMTLITSVFINCLSPFCGLQLYYVFPLEKCPYVRHLSKIKVTGLHIVGTLDFSIFTKISSCTWALFGGSFLINWKKLLLECWKSSLVYHQSGNSDSKDVCCLCWLQYLG